MAMLSGEIERRGGNVGISVLPRRARTAENRAVSNPAPRLPPDGARLGQTGLISCKGVSFFQVINGERPQCPPPRCPPPRPRPRPPLLLSCSMLLVNQ